MFSKVERWIVAEANKIGLCAGEPKILECLWENDGAMPKDIASGCALDKSTVAGLLVRMEKMGLIKREANCDDCRCQDVFLTDEGKEKAKAVKTIVHKLNRSVLDGFSKEEKQYFLKMMGKVWSNLANK